MSFANLDANRGVMVGNQEVAKSAGPLAAEERQLDQVLSNLYEIGRTLNRANDRLAEVNVRLLGSEYPVEQGQDTPYAGVTDALHGATSRVFDDLDRLHRLIKEIERL